MKSIAITGVIVLLTAALPAIAQQTAGTKDNTSADRPATTAASKNTAPNSQNSNQKPSNQKKDNANRNPQANDSGITSHNATSEAGGGVGDDEDMARVAYAILRPTDGHTARGRIRFDRRQNGVGYTIVGSDLSPGRHAVHIQLYGDCSAPDATSAGPNFNLRGRSTYPPLNIKRITGNLGNLNVDANRTAVAHGVLDHGSLNGEKSIVGRSVVIYAKANNPHKPPTGAPGKRAACGVIGIANPNKPRNTQ